MDPYLAMGGLFVCFLIMLALLHIVNCTLAQYGIWPMLTRLVAPGSYAMISDGLGACIA